METGRLYQYPIRSSGHVRVTVPLGAGRGQHRLLGWIMPACFSTLPGAPIRPVPGQYASRAAGRSAEDFADGLMLGFLMMAPLLAANCFLSSAAEHVNIYR
jgi:hypothetical protein